MAWENSERKRMPRGLGSCGSQDGSEPLRWKGWSELDVPKGSEDLYEFVQAAVTKCHKMGVLKPLGAIDLK